MTKEQKDDYDNFRKTALLVSEAMVEESTKLFRNDKHRHKMVLAVFGAFMEAQDQQLTATVGSVTFEIPLILREVTWNT